MTILPHKVKKVQKSEHHSVQPESRQATRRGRRFTADNGRKTSKSKSVTSSKSVISKFSKNPESQNENDKEELQNLSSERSVTPACNSDDEHGVGFRDDELEADFEESLRRSGLIIKKVRGDGACLFRAVADQIYGDEEMHEDVRRLCLDYLEKNRDHFAQFVTEDFSGYLARKRSRYEHGNHVELQAISEIFARPIEIYEYRTKPHNISSVKVDKCSRAEPSAPIRLSYHGFTHYNSVIDPNTATVGVGLGLPGYTPGAADRDLLQKAVRNSETELIEDAMLNDKIKLSDFERTEEELNEQSMTAKKGTKQTNGEEKDPESVQPQPCCSRDTLGDETELCSEQSIWDSAATNDAEENALLAQVMALSQQEFLNSLKQAGDGGSDLNQAGSSKSIEF